jgi:hypothetical protein
MPDPTATDPLDAELRRIARALVAEAPYAPGLPNNGRVVSLIAGTTPPRRRPPWIAVAAIVVVGVVAGLLAALDGEPGDGQIDLATDAGLEPAPQRLILFDWTRETWRELPRGGKPVPLELAGLDPHGAPRPLPGGGHVVVGVHPVPEPPPEGFNEFTDMTYGLAVVGDDGTVTIERDIEPATLVGVTTTEAILARQPRDDSGEPSGPTSIMAHDLTTGDERLIRRDVAFDSERRASADWAIVAGDLVGVEATQLTEPTGEYGSRYIPGSEECTLSVTDLATGDVTETPLDLDCSMIRGLRASPDGSQAAVAYEATFTGGAELPVVRLAVIGLADGTVHHDQLLGHNIDCRTGCPPGTQSADYEGMAWDDASTLRVATVDLAARYGDLIVQTITVG